MKRSQTIALVLLGGASVGALAGCSRSGPLVRVTTDSVYANNFYLPGVGYYHAPFRAFYPQPYNAYNAATHQYYFGGQWAGAPHQSPVNLSAPTVAAATFAEAMRTDIARGGFGGYGGGHYYGS